MKGKTDAADHYNINNGQYHKITRITFIWSTLSLRKRNIVTRVMYSLQWRHNGRHSVSNLHPHGRLLNHLFRHRSKKTSKLRVTGLCAGNSPGTGEFPAQMASNVENVSIWWRHHGIGIMMGVSRIYSVDCCHYRLHSHVPFMNSFSPRKNGRHCIENIFRRIFGN